MAKNFGPMNSKCFISRNQLLIWANDLLKLNLTKIEQLGAGSVYCQLFDVIYPGKVQLNKVKWKAKFEYEFIHNFKILQQAFDDVKINKLAKAKYQDNLEFGQWMKRFFDLNCKEKGKDYDAIKRRQNIEPDFSFCGKGVPPKYTLMIFKSTQQTNKQPEENNNVSSQQSEDNNTINDTIDISAQSIKFLSQETHKKHEDPADEDIIQPIVKKIKLNNELPMSTLSSLNVQNNFQQQQTENKQPTQPIKYQECKFFSKKTNNSQQQQASTSQQQLSQGCQLQQKQLTSINGRNEVQIINQIDTIIRSNMTEPSSIVIKQIKQLLSTY